MKVKEFKTWLAGVIAFQPKDWKPTAKQWETIYEMIQTMDDEPVYVQPPQQFHQNHVNQQHQHTQQPTYTQHSNPQQFIPLISELNNDVPVGPVLQFKGNNVPVNGPDSPSPFE